MYIFIGYIFIDMCNKKMLRGYRNKILVNYMEVSQRKFIVKVLCATQEAEVLINSKPY